MVPEGEPTSISARTLASVIAAAPQVTVVRQQVTALKVGDCCSSGGYCGNTVNHCA
ncbi:hypothetical protein GQ44DRAFT_712352 [Phaeosphaeriaceae sp. PMI808]|nr:hypothetical protein GQ44DRAFT_712352 [Phaeosphaeriaceae sp. PMI808]